MKTLLFATSIFISLISSNAAYSQSVTIPAGEFKMGCSAEDTKCEKDEGATGGTIVSVSAFKIDTNEVTVKEYQACMDAGQCERPKDHARNKYCNLGAKDRDNHPINCVDWSDAAAYCAYKNGRLPREAEWEKAARAGTNTVYPWGNTVSCQQAILDDGKTQGSVKDEHDGCGEDRTWPIGSRPANAFGIFDMHGNAGEWTSTWYAKDGIAMYAKGELDGPVSGKQRVVRGGSWDENIANLRSSFRNVKPPVSGKVIYGSIGFRCAYD